MDNGMMFHLRFNHAAENENQRWKIIYDGEEVWVKNIVIDGYAYTTQDWMPLENSYKWHISIFGHGKIIDDVAYIKSSEHALQNEKFRHTLKSLSSIGMETFATLLVSYVSNKNVETALSLSSGYLSLRCLLYYLHERVWYKFVKLKK